VEALVLETCRRNGIVDGYIRLLVTRGAGDLGLDPSACPRPDIIVIARAGVTLYKRTPDQGITAVTSAFRRNAADATSPAIKSLNYLNNILAKIEATDRGADEAILLDRDGVAEATADNVFIVTERAVVTPPTSTNLRGITRETIRSSPRAGHRTEERALRCSICGGARSVHVRHHGRSRADCVG
jgi:branched-chain amino acid aminotransferase